MKDFELRAIVLEKFYQERRKVSKIWGEAGLPQSMSPDDFFDICSQLAEHGLISWKPMRDGLHIKGGVGKITASGIDVIEGKAKAPIAIVFDQRIISITDSDNVQVGNSNSLSASAN